MSVIDAYTHYVLEFMEGINKTSQKTMADLVSPLSTFLLLGIHRLIVVGQFASYDPNKINSHPGVRDDLFPRPLDKALITDFFGGVSANVEVMAPEEVMEALPPRVNIPPAPKTKSEQAKAPLRLPVKELEKGLWRLSERWREARAWGGIVLLGSLVGWVCVRRS